MYVKTKHAYAVIYDINDPLHVSRYKVVVLKLMIIHETLGFHAFSNTLSNEQPLPLCRARHLPVITLEQCGQSFDISELTATPTSPTNKQEMICWDLWTDCRWHNSRLSLAAYEWPCRQYSAYWQEHRADMGWCHNRAAMMLQQIRCYSTNNGRNWSHLIDIK